MPSILDAIRGEYRRYRALAERTFAQLDDTQLCLPGPGGGLSVAQIVWHVGGNLRSRFTDFQTSDGEKPWREREEEFAARTVARAEFDATWQGGWQVLETALDALTDEDLQRTVTIRQQPLSIIEALQRSLAHVSYHVGQIVYLGKALRGDSWEWLSIPPGGTAAYNAAPTKERAPGTLPPSR